MLDSNYYQQSEDSNQGRLGGKIKHCLCAVASLSQSLHKLLMMMVVDNSRNVNANYLVIESIGHLSRAAIENSSLLDLDSIFSSHNKFAPVN